MSLGRIFATETTEPGQTKDLGDLRIKRPNRKSSQAKADSDSARCESTQPFTTRSPRNH
jgi:hypothetical protein